MGKRKEKIRPLSAWRFLFAWLVAHAVWSLGNMVSTALLLYSGAATNEPQIVVLLMTPVNLLWTVIIATIQFRLLRRFLRKPPLLWVQAHVALSLLVSLATFVNLWVVQQASVDVSVAMNLMSLLQYGVIMTVEWFILRHYVRFAWLWIPATVGVVLFRHILWQLMGAEFMTPTASFGLNLGTMVGGNLILGLAIVLMVYFSRRSDNTWQDSDVDEDDDSNYERLADADSDPQVDEAPLVQRRAQSY